MTYRNFTPLTTLRSEILIQIHDNKYVRWPEKMKTQSNKRNRDKYYEFHQDHDHEIDNCHDLKQHLKDLIQHGYLGGFIDIKIDKSKEELRPRPLGQAPPAEVIIMISGGMAFGGKSSSGRKAYVRLLEIDDREQKRRREDPITFTDDDLRGVQTSHNNALVITAEIANFKVRRILVDIGSSDDILFEDAFEQLSNSKDCLTLVNTPLMGFFGESLMPKGKILLPLLIENGEITSIAMLDFFVIHCLSSYNAILD
ncbi:PREDICTED: uncharacterized protein LOC104603216 [Nelumbo nucifera]|uniref:Uncharacterized protein LOC104603216 n=1 Tax=Nelumbo nucifera TaxID=4432 RepID=A0A1U8ARU7_NELNU|nr:PREDICTED: uncharacterized protein LOC104603216 [Nelumbo nucifera]